MPTLDKNPSLAAQGRLSPLACKVFYSPMFHLPVPHHSIRLNDAAKTLAGKMAKKRMLLVIAALLLTVHYLLLIVSGVPVFPPSPEKAETADITLTFLL